MAPLCAYKSLIAVAQEGKNEAENHKIIAGFDLPQHHLKELMKQIVYTCLLAIRLITSVTNPGKQTASLDLFSNALMNRAFEIVFYDPGMYSKKSDVNYYVEQVNTSQA